jgi:hypothetical protein
LVVGIVAGDHGPLDPYVPLRVRGKDTAAAAGGVVVRDHRVRDREGAERGVDAAAAAARLVSGDHHVRERQRRGLIGSGSALDPAAGRVVTAGHGEAGDRHRRVRIVEREQIEDVVAVLAVDGDHVGARTPDLDGLVDDLEVGDELDRAAEPGGEGDHVGLVVAVRLDHRLTEGRASRPVVGETRHLDVRRVGGRGEEDRGAETGPGADRRLRAKLALMGSPNLPC